MVQGRMVRVIFTYQNPVLKLIDRIFLLCHREATASMLRSIIPNADIRGESSGTAEQLAASLLQYNLVLRNYCI